MPARTDRGNNDDEDDDEVDDEEDDDFDEFPFTNLTDEICQLFVKVPLDQFRQRIEFLDDNRQLLNSDIVDVNATALLKQSIQFSRMGKHAATTACIFSLALLHVSRNHKQLPVLFANLLVQETKEKKGFNDIVKSFNTIVTKQALQDGPLSTPQRKSSRRKPRRGDDATLRISELFQQGMILDANYISVEDDANESVVPEKLGRKYKIRTNGKDFFVPGKVFAILWTEATSKRMATEELMKPRKNESLSVVRFGETVFTHIRRMVVVRSRKGSSWCVSIGTYEGQGLLKRGLKEDDINDHTIIYDVNKGVEYLEGEPRSRKRPIGVEMIRGETLDSASRVHLGKPYNVEWNVKVMDIGQVTKQDLPALLDYVKQVMGV